MLHSVRAKQAAIGLLFVVCAFFALSLLRVDAQPQFPRSPIRLTAVDENGIAVPDATVSIHEQGLPPIHLRTDYTGHCSYILRQNQPYAIHAEEPGFYQADESAIDPSLPTVRLVLAHEQIVREQVNVNASSPGIDTQEASGKSTLNTPEIVNIPYQTSRDIRYLLPFNPGVIQDTTEQVHVAGSEAWETLDTLDGFDIRSPAGGTLDMRVSADAVRSIDVETTRYPVEFGRATGGVIAFYAGMGDNKFRFNATNFFPSLRDLNGIRFDKFVPRFTFSGPIVHDRAWWYDGLEIEYDNIYITELPTNADNDQLVRGSNLIKLESKLTPANTLTAGLLFNDYHSPYDGISSLTPQQGTTKRDIIAWLPYMRDQWSLHAGALLDIGIAEMRFRDGHEPHGNLPYQITPELPKGSYFENLTGRSQRLEGTAALYVPPRNWFGRHDLKLGLDLDHIDYNQDQTRAPVSYLREDGSLLRQSSFPQQPPFTIHNVEIGAYLQDRWQPWKQLLIEPGLRFDWDEIIRRPLLSPRLAAVYAPGNHTDTKLSAGIGIYYEHTQMEYLAQPWAGIRYDTYYEADGATPTGPAQETEFTAVESSLREPRALNWSLGAERNLPWSIYAGANFIQKRTSGLFAFVNQSGPAQLSGNYLLANARQDHYNSEEFDLRRLFANGYTVYLSYTHSSAHTNSALDYLPLPSPLGPQQSGPLPWDSPNRTISWGWLPLLLPKLRNIWDFVYTIDWRTGFPYTAVNAAQQVVGAAGAQRFPDFINFSPGLEWRFHFRGAYFGLRGVMENAFDRENPAEVNNVVDSPQYGAFSEFEGRAFTARLRLIESR